jgi:hypothetical protein
LKHTGSSVQSCTLFEESSKWERRLRGGRLINANPGRGHKGHILYNNVGGAAAPLFMMEEAERQINADELRALFNGWARLGVSGSWRGGMRTRGPSCGQGDGGAIDGNGPDAYIDLHHHPWGGGGGAGSPEPRSRFLGRAGPPTGRWSFSCCFVESESAGLFHLECFGA